MADDAIQKIDQIIAQLEGRMLKVVNRHSAKLVSVTLSEHLSGPTSSSSVSRRTKGLAGSVRPLAGSVSGNTVSGGMAIGQKYAGVHIGPRGTSVTITPKSKRFLAIPLQAAKTAGGVARGGPLSGIWGPTFIAKGIIFGYSGGTKGSTRKSPIPLFVLKRSVVVPRRVDPNKDLLAKVRPQFIADLKAVATIGGP